MRLVRYFEINVPNPNMTQIYDIVLGDEAQQVSSNDGTKMIVKLPEGDTENHGVLTAATELTHQQAYDLRRTEAYIRIVE
jgi:hypothetical protein